MFKSFHLEVGVVLLLLLALALEPTGSFRLHAVATRLDQRPAKRSFYHPTIHVTNNYCLRDKPFPLAASKDTDETTKETLTLWQKISSKIKTKKFLITLWIHVLSGFVVANYLRTTTCWPASMLLLSQPIWNWVHGTSAMVFGGSIVTTTILEWNLDLHDGKFLSKLLDVETLLVLPALTGIMVSGVAQAFHGYASLRWAPRHVKSALHALLLFGLWWGVMDRRSQGKLQQSISSGDGLMDANVLSQRKLSNVVSCGFLLALYAIMILKPGFIPI